MSETSNKGKGAVSLDATLREWPEAEKSASEWDERAESIVGRLRRGERGATAAYVSDDDLFAEPLGQSSEDGHNSPSSPGAPANHPSLLTPRTREGKMQTSDRERDRKSLQDLAKMAQGLTPPPSSVAAFGPVPSSRSVSSLPDSKKDDSGIVDLAAASAADPQAAMRAQSTPLASQSLFDHDPPVPPPPPVNAPPPSVHPAAHAYQQPAPSVPPPPSHGYHHTPSGPPSPYSSVHPMPMPRKKSGSGGVIFALGGLLAISAAAAGGFLWIRNHPAAPPPAAVAVSQPAAEPAAPALQAAAPTTPAPEAKKADEGTLDPNALPSVAATPAASHKGSGKVAMAKPKAADDGDKPEPVAAAAKPAKETKVAKAEPPPPSGPPGDLNVAMQGAVGPKEEGEKKPTAAAGTSTGNVPQKPSQGAVTGSIGAVLPGARSCLGPDDPISRASIVFNSDGSVASVSVSGAAAGKPAEQCIKAALQKAKLQPFAEPSYTANITIRHN